MKQDKKNFQHESIQNAKNIETILKSVADGLSNGKLQFSDEDDDIVFQPEGLMQLRLTAVQDGNHQRFTIKVSWQSDSDKLKNKSLTVES